MKIRDNYYGLRFKGLTFKKIKLLNFEFYSCMIRVKYSVKIRVIYSVGYSGRAYIRVYPC